MNREKFIAPGLVFSAALIGGIGVALLSPAEKPRLAVRVGVVADRADCEPIDKSLRYEPLAVQDLSLTPSSKPLPDPLARDERVVPEAARRFNARGYVLIYREVCFDAADRDRNDPTQLN